MLLIAGTYRLWMPPSAFPQVPLLKMPDFPGWIDWVPIGLVVPSLLAVICFPNRRGCWWIVAGGLGLAFLIDQHRLQPWAYQSAIYALVLAMVRHEVWARRLITSIAISVYVYSGLGKLDYQFCHTVGQEIIDVIARPLGGLPGLDDSTRLRVACLLPLLEMFFGLCLIVRRLRPYAAVAIIAMHLCLLLVLGPWGLNHSYGVLIWNAALILQAWCLFVIPSRRDRPVEAPPAHLSGTTVGRALAACLTVIAIVMPLFERRQYWDHWLSWALYSPHSSRVDVELSPVAVESLDPSRRQFLEEDHDQDGWQRLSLGRWSLESLGVPIYPQARYQLGLIRQVADDHAWRDSVRVRVGGVADRWTGKRDEQYLIGRSEIEAALDPFWLGP
ncbi:MAG: hypothetical protein MI861_26015 [Pirellulales bacterium]|nr:hypothetical protein [Pirellulales bacterium]